MSDDDKFYYNGHCFIQRGGPHGEYRSDTLPGVRVAEFSSHTWEACSRSVNGVVGSVRGVGNTPQEAIIDCICDLKSISVGADQLARYLEGDNYE